MTEGKALRIGLVGGNGQVGAELCLILRQQQNLEVIAICRNRFGSAFLRSQGVACRHGSVADSSQAKLLIGDCDVVVNCALGTGSLREQHDANGALVENCIAYARASALIIHLSTVAVYGNPSPDAMFRWRSAYAREKLFAERRATACGRRTATKVFILRLGHVCGELQQITRFIREEIAAGQIRLPAPDRMSNLVHTATVAEAILHIARKPILIPGVYDLLNVPQWSWRQVYEFEARATGCVAVIAPTAAPIAVSRLSIRSAVRALGGALGRSQIAKEYVMQLVARLSPKANARIQALYYQARAAREIAALSAGSSGGDAARWREVGWRLLPSLSRTIDLLEMDEYRVSIARNFSWTMEGTDTFSQ